MMVIDWDSPTWGKPGHNVHVSETGSEVASLLHEDDGGQS